MTDNAITKIELPRIVLAAALRECKNATIAMSDGSAAGARLAMQHRWRLSGIHRLASDLYYEAGMLEDSCYGRIVEALDYAFSLDIRDMGDWAEERRCD